MEYIQWPQRSLFNFALNPFAKSLCTVDIEWGHHEHYFTLTWIMWLVLANRMTRNLYSQAILALLGKVICSLISCHNSKKVHSYFLKEEMHIARCTCTSKFSRWFLLKLSWPVNSWFTPRPQNSSLALN